MKYISQLGLRHWELIKRKFHHHRCKSQSKERGICFFLSKIKRRKKKIEMRCYSLFDRDTAVNESWFCIHENHMTTECHFLFNQQIHRDERCSAIDGVISLTLLFFAIPINLIHSQHVFTPNIRPEYKFLMTLDNISNILIASHVAVGGMVRVFGDWLFGQIDCILWMFFWVWLNTLAAWIVVLMSCERRSCIANFFKLKTPQFKYRFTNLLIVTLIVICVNTIIWVYPFFVVKISKSLKVKTDHIDHSICTTFIRSKFSFLSFAIYFLITFLIPFLITFSNFIATYIEIRQGNKEVELFSKRLKRQRQFEIHLVKLSFITAVISTLCVLPHETLIGFIFTIDRYNLKQTQSSMYYYACILISIRSVISPLIKECLCNKNK